MNPAVEIIRPKNRAAWLEARGKDVTASQIGALFGEHEYLTAFELWAVKTGRLPRSAEETPAIQRGRLLEAVGVQLLRESHPDWRIVHNAAENVYFRDPVARLGATPDVLVGNKDGNGVVQIKSVEAGVFKRKWLDEDGNVEPPLWIALQATLEAHLAGASWAAVAPLVVGHGLEMPLVEIPLMPGVVAAMEAKVADFWQMVAEGREPVPDYTRDGATIEALYQGDDAVEVDLSANNRIPQLLSDRSGAIARRKAAEAELEQIDAEIKAAMGDATVGHIGQGRRITWKVQGREGRWLPPSTFRVLRVPATQE